MLKLLILYAKIKGNGNKTTRLILCICAFIIAFPLLHANADIYSQPNKHVIISFDTAVPQFNNILLDRAKMERALQPVINSLNLSQGDFISLVNFGISSTSNDLSELARTINDRKGEPITWIPYESLHNTFIMGSWLDMIQSQGISFTGRHNRSFSMLTGSKAYTLLSQKNNEKQLASETYLVMVTDDNYNGCDDINKEFSTMSSTTLDSDEFLETCQEVSKYYNFYFKKNLSNLNIAPGLNSYKAMVFKVVPSSNMALSSVVNYPANYGLKRVKGGYQIDFDFESADPEYLIKRLEVSYMDKHGDVHTALYDSDEGLEKHIKLYMPNNLLSGDSVKVQLKGWLVQQDDIYGATLLNPNSADFQRLKISTSLALKNEAKAYGFIPIPDALWITNNYKIEVFFWNVIYGVIIVAFMIWLFRTLAKRLSVYHPDNAIINLGVKSSTSK